MVTLDMLSDADKALSHATLAALDAAHSFSASKNAEIVSRWLWLALKSNYETVYEPAVEFAKAYGRMKMCRPTYRALAAASDSARELAVKTFTENRARYHPIAQKMIAKDLGVE